MTSSVDADSDPAAWIASTLSISLDHAEHLLMLTHWVDHERVIERYGYPRDNVLPEPLSERFADPRKSNVYGFRNTRFRDHKIL